MNLTKMLFETGMKINMLSIKSFLYLLPLVLLAACNSDELSPGVEYMPDMYRSPAIEEYVDYGDILDRTRDSLTNKLSAMVPPEGTIPFSADQVEAMYSFPYEYPNTDEGYAMASANLRNPLAFNEEVYNEGKVLFQKFCIHCHGEKGKGQGSIVETGAFPPPPSYSNIIDLTEGKMFHTLMYGKGNMGSHSSMLNKKELWTLVHYVKTLRAEKYSFADYLKGDTPTAAQVEGEEEGDN